MGAEGGETQEASTINGQAVPDPVKMLDKTKLLTELNVAEAGVKEADKTEQEAAALVEKPGANHTEMQARLQHRQAAVVRQQKALAKKLDILKKLGPDGHPPSEG